MEKLFVVKSIEVNAPPEKVWKVLTESEFTNQWVDDGWRQAGSEGMRISSDWKPASEVLWKDKNDTLLVKGNVTELNPYKLLHFTVFDVNSKAKIPTTDEDGITYELAEQDGNTILTIRQGDFSVMKEGKKYHQKTADIWETVLPKVKELAEENKDIEERPTCGKGLAENSTIPARFGEIIASIAENLELHMGTLDLKDPNARLEFDAYQKLAHQHRDIAARLIATAGEMYSYYNLPIARHDEKKLIASEY